MKVKSFTLAACLLGAAACPDVHAQWWNPMDPTPPKYRGTTLAEKVVYDRNLRNTAQLVIGEALGKGDFDKLERMHDEFARSALRATDGTWMLESFQWAFDNWFYVQDEATIRKLFADWKEKLPAARLRPIAEAEMWQRVAWKARGEGFSGSTTREGQDLFLERLRKASQALEASAEVGKDSPIWYWVALIVAGSSGRPQAQFDALFDEAVTKFPTYLPLYLTRVNYLLPQWGGDYDKVDAFVQDAVKRTAATEGTSFYAWIYVDILRKHQGDRFFGETRASWPVMRESFEDMTKRYPDVLNRIVYATFACLARDRETTARLISQLPPEVELGNFARGISTDGCRRFAIDRT